MSKPLADLLVLDLTRALAGPIAGRLLSDLGADVIKVEPPDGDLTRASKPRQDSMAVYFVQANVGKRCVSIDLGSEAGRDLLLAMVERADIVVENYRPGVMERLGLGYDALSAVNPRIILASVSGYGHGNVWSHRGAYAAAVQAETGLTADIAERRGDEPRNDPASQADVYGGLHALAAILAAVHHRHRTGRGQAVEVDMASATLVANDMTTANLRPDREVTDGFRAGSNWPPCYQLSTGRWVTVTADPPVEGSFRAWLRAMDRPELAEDPRFATMADRLEHEAELHDLIAEWVAGFGTAAELEEAIGLSGVLVADVRTAVEISETDWARERGAFVEVPVRPGHDPVTIPQSPWRFSDADGAAVPRVGFRGQHNREVLGEVFGFSEAQIDELEADGVISDRLPVGCEVVARLHDIVIDARHPASLARFWSAVLDHYRVAPYDDEELARLAGLGITSTEDDPTVLVEPVDGSGPRVWFQRVPEPKVAKNRVHLDVAAGEAGFDDELARLVGLGATVIDPRPDDDQIVVLVDPEGNEFCLIV